MRNAAFTLLCFVASGLAANAQRLSLLQQVGFENTKTSISYNDLQSFSPLGVKFSPQASLRLNYESKQGHGFFLGVASSRSIVSFSFTDPEAAMNSFAATTGSMQWRLEGGYQFNTKPISLGHSKQSPEKKQSVKSPAENTISSYSSRSGCSRSYSSHCGSRNSNKAKQSSLSKNNNSWVRIQPSIGMGYIPGVKTDVITKTQAGQTTYQYNAGNWSTALIAGAGFEFGMGKTRLLTLSVNYIKGLGNLDEQTISSVSAGKTVTTTMESSTSSWNVKVGIPLTLGEKRHAPKHKTMQRKSGCGQYRVSYRCSKSN